jgi:hypothetical protein
MGIDPQEGLIEGNEAGNVQNRVRHELVKLHTINKEEPTKKFVGRKRKTTEKEGKKHHPITARGLGEAFGAREDDLLPSDKEPLPLRFGQIRFIKFRGNPAGRHIPALLLRHLFFVHNLLFGHSEELRSGAARKIKSAGKMNQWWWRRGRELVNSKTEVSLL